MRHTTSDGFRRLSTTTAIMVYALMVVGGVVRVTGSGLGCPDWPLCHGRLLPPLEFTAILEYSHRTIAAIGGVLIILTALAAWRQYRHHRRIVGAASAVVGLLIIEVPLGAVVVLTELEPLIVAFHLGMALLILASSLMVAIAARQPAAVAGDAALRRPPTLLLTAVVALFLLLLTGALVVGGRASLACPDWPLCYGRLLPPASGSLPVALHLLHRYTVVAVLGLVAAVVVDAIRRSRHAPVSRRWAMILAVLFCLQIAIGAIQIALVLPPLWRALHLAAASGVWAALIVLTILASNPLPEQRGSPA